MKSPEALEDYLYRNIPISEAMGVRVARASTDSISLTAPLQANINHKRTAFGGSLQAVATLACWTLLHVNLREDADPSEIVITNSNIDYIRPVTADFTATAETLTRLRLSSQTAISTISDPSPRISRPPQPCPTAHAGSNFSKPLTGTGVPVSS